MKHRKVKMLCYECKKCNRTKYIRSDETIIETKCKICGNEMMYSGSFNYNPKNALRAVNQPKSQRTGEFEKKPAVECPYCHSTDTKKISGFSRAFSAEFFGLGSSKIGKQWHCNTCDSDF